MFCHQKAVFSFTARLDSTGLWTVPHERRFISIVLATRADQMTHH
jgi:hypothetical protein